MMPVVGWAGVPPVCVLLLLCLAPLFAPNGATKNPGYSLLRPPPAHDDGRGIVRKS